ncbi:MAG: ArsR family transcriptional regulator [Thermoplasmata archaeon]|nr:MAG: ArsR family transcriptional regulator [Thermoplasmata archaeon]
MRREASNFAFNMRDREIIDLMNSIGVNKNISKVVVFLDRTGEAKSRTIEDSVDLRQSEVSIITTWLRSKGWVTFRTIKKKGKGRPTNMFKMRYSLGRIVKEIEAEKITEMEDIKKRINHLKRLAK